MEKPFISVVLICYNAEKFIKKTIESVLNQTYKNFEFVIVNDCSTDKSEEIITSFSDSRIKYIKNEQNMKISKTRNRGVENTTGEYIAFLDSDDIWCENKLEKHVEHIKKTNAKISYSGYYFISNDGVLQNKIHHVPQKVDFKKLLKQNVITPSASVFQRDLLLKYPFYAEEVHEDFLCFLQMLKGENIFAYGIDEPLIYYRLTNNSKSRNKFKAMKMTLKTYKLAGLNFFKRMYCLPFYMLNGIKKYKGMKDKK